MSPEKIDTYGLDRSEVESQRSLGYVVHPTIFAQLDGSSRIADIGTGTGIFLADLSKQLPSSCQLDGFDMSSSQFMSPKSRPPNLSLRVHNAKDPFPVEFHGQYDLVHLRLLVMGLDEEDWETVTRNVTSLLKPGGALQWEETDFLNPSFVRGDPSFRVEAMDFSYHRLMDAAEHRLRFGFSNLPSIFKANGFTGIFQDVVPSDRDPEIRKGITRITFDTVFSWEGLQVKNGTPHALAADEIARLKSRVEKEIQSGGYVRYNIYSAVGWRP